MDKFRKLIVGGAAFALIAVNVPTVWGQDTTTPGKRPFARGERMYGGFTGAPLISIALRHKSELNLTEDQVANLEKIRGHYESQAKPIHEQLTALEKDVASLTQQSPANLIQIKAKIEEGEKYRSELRYLRIEALENGKTVLTPQQQDQLKTLVRSRQENFRKQQGQAS
jgi:Spy/CpxP family protein refolding chaperone